MFFSISKVSFLWHTLRLYCSQCSPLISILFVIIPLAKFILFLNLSVCSVNYSTMLFTRSVIAGLSPILLNADAKLFKQQLVDGFWYYFITGAAGWNYIFSVVFVLPIDTENNWYVFLSSSLNSVWCFFNRNMVQVSLNFLLTDNDQDQNNVLILLLVLVSYIIGVFLFLFILWLFLEDHNNLCIKPLFHSHFFSKILSPQMLGTEFHLDYFSIGLKNLLETFCCCKKWIINNFIYCSPIFLNREFFNIYIHSLLIFQSLMLFFYWNNHDVVVFIDFF